MERLAAGDHFVEHTTETPDVAAVVHLESSCLFGRHVVCSAEYDSKTGIDEVLRRRKRISFPRLPFASQFCEAKIENLNDAVAAQHYVVRLDVPMDDPDTVSRSKGACDLD